MPISGWAQNIAPVDVAVYFDDGAWADGVTAFERFLDWKGLSHERIDAGIVNRDDLRPRYSIVYFPGGYAYDYKTKITARGEQHIRDLVNDGGGYIGICAGAYFASDRVDWEGGSYPYTLGLFKGTARGAIAEIQPWPNWTMTDIAVVRRHEITRGQPATFRTLYFGGPAFYPDAGAIVDTLATWTAYHAAPAIIAFPYGAGRVLLSGPHPEIEENSARDGSDFGSTLLDPESEWGLLWAAMDWLLGRPVTDTILTGADNVIPASPSVPEPLTLWPNPAGERIFADIHLDQAETVSLTLFDALGRERGRVFEGSLQGGIHRFSFDLRTLDPSRSGAEFMVLQVRSASRIFQRGFLTTR